MGVVNVTPDYFSDGGRWLDATAAMRRGMRLMADGADLIDVGGESTRPGAERIPEDVELARVLPVVRQLAEEGVPVSVDTMRVSVAQACLDSGALLVNDVSGGTADPGMPQLVARTGTPFVVMHTRGTSRDMQSRAQYRDVVGEVVAELGERIVTLLAAGAVAEQMIMDPGLGFAKTGEHNWRLLADLAPLMAMGYPVLVGASRKRFLGTLLASDGLPRAVDGRDDATAATTVLAALAGAWCVRVHDARASADAVRVVAAAEAARRGAVVDVATEPVGASPGGRSAR